MKAGRFTVFNTCSAFFGILARVCCGFVVQQQCAQTFLYALTASAVWLGQIEDISTLVLETRVDRIDRACGGVQSVDTEFLQASIPGNFCDCIDRTWSFSRMAFRSGELECHHTSCVLFSVGGAAISPNCRTNRHLEKSAEHRRNTWIYGILG